MDTYFIMCTSFLWLTVSIQMFRAPFCLTFSCLHLTLCILHSMLHDAQFALYRVNRMRREDAKTIDCLLLDFVRYFICHLSSLPEPRE